MPSHEMITERDGAGDAVWARPWSDFRVAFAVVAVAFVLISVYSHHVQHVIVTRFGDADEYFFEAEQIAAGQTIRAETPYMYRIALPWLVAHTFPQQIEFGFRLYNTIAAAAGTMLLLLWLRRFGVHAGVAALTTILYTAEWISPARFIWFAPITCDPPFIALSMAALLVADGLRRQFSWPRALGLTAICALGGAVRETMLFAPIAFLFANVTFDPTSPPSRVPLTARLLPLVATAVVVTLCHFIPAEPRRQLSAWDNLFYLYHRKALFALPLSLYMTFGPIIAVVLYDWRAARDLLARHVYLVVFFGWCFLTSYIGGSDTERFVIWGAPVMYLLVAKALERHAGALLRSAWVFVALVIAQALSSHIFFAYPNPNTAVADWGLLTTVGEKIWGALNRLLVIDDFYWNLWSYFGSKPVHAVSLAIYLVFSLGLVLYLRRTERMHPELMGVGG
jgi:hypothetical protein